MQMCPCCKSDNPNNAVYCAQCGEQLYGLLGRGMILQRRYRIDDLLGCGGMGAVYLAYDMRLNRKVAVKENLEPMVSKQFDTEAQILAQLSHPNLPHVHDYFTEPNGRHYLVMEFIEGEDLDKIVQRRGMLTQEEALRIFEGVFEAVKYLHSQNPPIIHRDIKPQNIKVCRDGRAVLVDFGIAKVGSSGVKTRTGASGAGTPGYAPLEQYSGSGETNERTDVYALGATLYYALSGRTPPEATKRASGQDDLIPITSVNQSVDYTVQRVIDIAMSLRHQERWASVDEFWAQLCKVRMLPTKDISPPKSSIPRAPVFYVWCLVALITGLWSVGFILWWLSSNVVSMHMRVHVGTSPGAQVGCVAIAQDSFPWLKPANILSEVEQYQRRQRVSFLVQRAIQAKRNGDMKKALTLLREAITLIPNDPRALWVQGWIHLHYGEKEEAITCFRKVVQLVPNSELGKRAKRILSRITTNLK